MDALIQAAVPQQRLDQRMRASLRKRYTMAERMCTNNFKRTVVFEPYASVFPVTRMATSSQFGWTCSQPMHILDGYDLLKQKGRNLMFTTIRVHKPYLTVIAFDCRTWSLLTNIDWRRTVGRQTLKMVAEACEEIHQLGRYYLPENPGGALSWVEAADGKFTYGDQCAYGKIGKRGQPCGSEQGGCRTTS
ncbi:unnamed protein product [Effrenium voratum]|nr:unnamed protein product [Effrenium voratum]